MSLFVPDSVIKSRWDITIPDEWAPSYNVAPENDVLAIRNDEPDRGDLLNWGLLPSWADDPEDIPRPINARAETVDEKSMFQDAFENRRCLIIADGYYEWKQTGGHKQPYRIERDDNNPFAFAGLWDRWSSTGTELLTCAVLTTEPNQIVEPIHDRMPVMLTREDEEDWLQAEDISKLDSLMKPYCGDDLTAFEVSTRVNNPENDDPGVIEPLEGEQSGLGDFSV